MGFGYHEKADEENPQSEDEKEAETKRLNQPTDDIELKKITTRSFETGMPEVIRGETKPMFKQTHLKNAIYLFNGILAILGLAILILAIWVRVDPEFWEYKRNINIDNFYAVCHMLIVAGLIIFFVACVGCVGACVDSTNLLIAYTVIFVLMFILQLAAVIMVFSAPYSKSIKGALTTQIKRQIDNRDVDDTSRLIIDLMQQNLHCCGSESQSDYINNTPNSCQNPSTGSINQDGCSKMLLAYLKTKAGVIAGITIPVLLFQGLALFVTIAFIYNEKNESKYFM